jgi:molecular chaperone DnaJ
VAEEDYYATLGVNRNASEDEIKRAYRKLARELHPDRHAGAPATAGNSEERFKLVNRAYEALKDPERRRQYDMFGAAGERAGDPFAGFAGGGLGDIFDEIGRAHV